MLTSNEKPRSPALRHGLLSTRVMFLAIAPALLIPLLARQPKEVSAAVYSVYVAAMALVAVGVFVSKNRRALPSPRWCAGHLLDCSSSTPMPRMLPNGEKG